MRRVQAIVCAALLLLPTALPAYTETPLVQAAEGTVVTSSIMEDTVWTKEGSPYILGGIVNIQSNAVLRIEPGVQVIGQAGRWIEVFGKLEAVGTEQERIMFDDVYVNSRGFSGTSVHIEYADMSRTGGFLLTNAGDPLTLRHNRFSKGSLDVSALKEAVFLEYNLFQQGAGLDIDNSAKPVYVRGNTFFNPGTTYHDVSIYAGSPYASTPNVELTGNNFFGHDHLHVRMQGGSTVRFNGQNNYWGTVDRARISRLIEDGSDIDNKPSLDVGAIAYKPFANGFPMGVLEAPAVDALGDSSAEVSGYTDAGSTVQVRRGGAVLGEAVSSADGNFLIPISKQPDGTVLKVQATDSYGRVSAEAEVTVVDLTAPPAPMVRSVTNASEEVTGTAEPFAVVSVTAGGRELASGQTAADGSFAIPIPRQKHGTSLMVVARDGAGHTSLPATLLVKDVIPPNQPTLDGGRVTEYTRDLYGAAEPGTLIEVRAGVLLLGAGYADAYGRYYMGIGAQKSGTVLEVTAADGAGLRSEALRLIVADTTAPVLLLADLTDKTSEVRGLSEAGSRIAVLKTGVEIGTGTAGSDGVFAVVVPAQPAGTELVVQARDASGNTTGKTVFVRDVTPPSAPQAGSVTDQTKEMFGKTEPFASVSIYNGMTLAGQTQADGTGAWKVSIPVQKAGSVLEVTAIDASGNISVPTRLTVKDVTAPLQPQVNAVTNKTSEVTGKTEKYASVTLKIGTASYTSKADMYGGYRVKIPVQNAGAVLSVTVKDGAGNVSAARSVTVSKVAPNMPAVNTVTNKAAEVTGKTEKYASVTVKIGTVSYTSKADVYGGYKVKIPVQPAGAVLSVTAKDATGNVSAARSVTVSKVAPNMPTVSAVRTYSTIVSGKTEAYASVTVKIGSSVYTSRADIYGGFKVGIPKQRAGTNLSVTVKDAKGQVSAARVVTVY